tara:strand:+ start:781 stop:1062 length:282 start_codon:yes stop_codon:yes gene_type:complete
MPRSDYEAIAKIIEDVIGKDTVTCVKLLEGIRFYFDKKLKEIEIIRAENMKPISFTAYKVKEWKKQSNSALKRYTAKLNEEIKLEKEACSITG